MNILCLDDVGNLSLTLEPITDNEIRSDLMKWLKLSPYVDIDGVWIFPKTPNKVKFISIAKQTQDKCIKIKIPLETCPQLSEKIFSAINENSLKDVVQKAQKIKDICPICEKKWAEHEEKQLLFCQNKYQPKTSPKFQRDLLPYQKKSVDHLTQIGFGANFSVPGSGKTTVTYAAISNWLEDGTINKILVIGPTPSFFPWEDEYRECFGEIPDSIRISGDKADLLTKLTSKLFLMHFATVMYKTKEIIEFLDKPGNDVVVIIDESHNIKNIDEGAWAEAVRKISSSAKRRIILSGTPMPNTAGDLWVQMDFLWPHEKILGDAGNFKRYTKNNGIGKWKSTIEPLFTRIKKSELGLDPPIIKKYYVDLSPTQSEIYNVLAEKTLDEIYSFRDRSKLHEYRKARLIRMLQVASNPALLYEQDDEFTINDEYGYEKNPTLSSVQSLDSELYEKIKNYSISGEIPSKLVQVEKLTRELLKNGEKVVIWSNFLKNIRVLQNQLLKDQNPIVIQGDISKDSTDDVNRDSLIKEFKDDDNPRVLIATPPSLSESVSLHIDDKRQRVCSHAIYLDRNFNGAQFMQSMDRIHRVGMDLKDDSSFTINYEDSEGDSTFKRNQVYYHFFIANNTIDTIIHDRLRTKLENMHEALDDDWPQILDFDGKPTIISQNQSQNDFNSLVDNLKKSEQLNKENHEN